jgi:hypothetical protein
MTEDKFRLEARRLIGKGIADRAERMAAVSGLIDSYVEENGEAPDGDVLDKLTDYVLNEELTDITSWKTHHEEYPLLSISQRKRRTRGDVQLSDIPGDSLAVGHKELIIYESSDERSLRELNSETARYRKLNRKQPVTTYNLRETMGDEAFEAAYPTTPSKYPFFRGEEHAEWSLDIRRRDGFTCQKCGKHGYSGIHAHHIEAYNVAIDLRCDINNGIALCIGCHRDFHKIYGMGGNTRVQLDEWMGDSYYE